MAKLLGIITQFMAFFSPSASSRLALRHLELDWIDEKPPQFISSPHPREVIEAAREHSACAAKNNGFI